MFLGLFLNWSPTLLKSFLFFWGTRKRVLGRAFHFPESAVFPSFNLNLKELIEAPLPGEHSHHATSLCLKSKQVTTHQNLPPRPLHACKMQPTFPHPRFKGKQKFFSRKNGIQFMGRLFFLFKKIYILEV